MRPGINQQTQNIQNQQGVYNNLGFYGLGGLGYNSNMLGQPLPRQMLNLAAPLNQPLQKKGGLTG